MADHSLVPLVPSSKSAERAAQVLAAARLPADGPEQDDDLFLPATSKLNPTSEEEDLLGAAGGQMFGSIDDMLGAHYNNSGGSTYGYGGMNELGELYPDLRGSGAAGKNKKKKKRRDNVGKSASKIGKQAEFLAYDAGGSYNTPGFVEMQYPKQRQEVTKLMAATDRATYGDDLMDFDGGKQRILQNDTSSVKYALTQGEAPIDGAVMMNAPVTVFGSSIMGRVEPVTTASEEVKKSAIKEAKNNLAKQRKTYDESIEGNLLSMQR